MSLFLALTVIGVADGCVYALIAAGLVVTYTTSGVFNFAHGATGMFAAFLYWQLYVGAGLPAVIALLIVLFVFAPVMGIFSERVLMRRLYGKPIVVSMTVTLGVLLFLIAAAQVIWDPTTTRTVPEFFGGGQVSIFGVAITYQQIIMVCCAIAAALALRFFLHGTRFGTAMRAVVDEPDLVAMTGTNPYRYARMGWIIGAVLSSLAGVLLAPIVTLNVQTLTFLVINGYAAAIFGRLRSLPLTFIGALLLGLAQSYAVGYLPLTSFVNDIEPAVPMIFLFVVLLVLPEGRVRGRQLLLEVPRNVNLTETVVAAVVFVGVAGLAAEIVSGATLNTTGHGLAIAIIMLSLVPLLGYAGQISLCQFTFAGIGAVAMGRWFGGSSIFGLLAAVGISAAAGALVAAPAIRLRGLYLALLTLAFAEAMDSLFFANVSIFGIESSIGVGRVHLGVIPTQSPKAYFILLAVVFSLIGIGLVLVRRSRFGRRLVAMGDSPEACETLGISVTRTKLLVFSVSAGIAGLGGALYGGQQTEVGPGDFATLVSLTVVLLAILWGAKSVPAMLLAGLTFVIGPVVQEHVPALRDVLYLAVGLAAISVGQNPNGAFGNKTLLSWLFARHNSLVDPGGSVGMSLPQSPKDEQPVLGGG